MREMLFKELDSEKARVTGDCLRAAIQGPLFPEWEFHTLFGLSRDDVRQVEHEWPSAADEEKSRPRCSRDPKQPSWLTPRLRPQGASRSF